MILYFECTGAGHTAMVNITLDYASFVRKQHFETIVLYH